METKSAVASSTIVNGIIGFLILIVKLFGFDLDEGIITELVLAAIGLYAVVKVIIGRMKATTRIAGIV